MSKGFWGNFEEAQKNREVQSSLEAAITSKEQELKVYKTLLHKYTTEERDLTQFNQDLELSLLQRQADSVQLDEEIQQKKGEYARTQRLIHDHNLYYRQAYTKRNDYYKHFTAGQYEESREIASLFKERNYTGIVVSPIAVERLDSRSQRILKNFANKGYLCFVGISDEQAEFSLQEVSRNYFQINREEYLIPVLQSMHPLILNTCLMQNAWIDCLPNKTIWYDITTRLDTLPHYDKGLLVKHYEMLHEAALVTYAQKHLKEQTHFRKDAIWLAQPEQAEELLLQRIECAPLFANKTFHNTIGVYTSTFFDYEGANFFSGGAERYLIDLHEICKELGYNMEIYQYGNSPWYRQFRGIDVYSIGGGDRHMNQPVSIELMKRLNHAYVNQADGKFHLNIYSAFFEAYPEAAHPSIGISHGVTWDHPGCSYTNGEQFWQTNLRFIKGAQNVERLISVDTKTANWLQTVDYEVAERTVTIPNYVEHEEFYPVERKSDKIRITYPRRLNAARGLYLTLDIVDEILSEYENVEFHFVGKGVEEDTKHIDTKQKQWQGRVFRYHRDPNDMHQVYKEADIVLIPTLYSEGTSLSCLEACASGNAVISTRIGGLADLIINDFNGLLISPTREDLLQAVRRLVEDEELRQRLSRNAIEVSKAFAKKQWKEKWKKEIQNKIGPVVPAQISSVRKSVEVLVTDHQDLQQHAKRINTYLHKGFNVFVRPELELDHQQSFHRYQLLKPDAELAFEPDEVVDLRQSSLSSVSGRR